MDDYLLVPVNHRPEFENVSLVPVDYDPFIEDGVTEEAQTQPGQPLDQQQQRPAGVARLYVGRPANNTQASEPSPPTASTLQPALPTASPGAQVLPNERQSGDKSEPATANGVSGQIGAKIAELATDFYNQSILKPARDLREMGHDLITDPDYFLHAIGPSLVGLGMSAPTARVGSIGGAERAEMIHNVLDKIAYKNRTTAVLETDAGRIIAGGTRDLDPLQRAALGRGEIAAKARGVHAEATALKKAVSIGARPSALAVTRTICPDCAAVIESLGAG